MTDETKGELRTTGLLGSVMEESQSVTEPLRDLDGRFENKIEMSVPVKHNPRLRRLLELVNEDEDLYGLWIAANVNAVDRLNMTDHGPVHVKIVMNIAIRMLRLLADAGVEPSVALNYGMSA